MANNLLQMAQAASTNVHNNIDNLILKAEQDKLDQTGFMYADKSPAYIGGVDPVVENIAMGPLLTLKSLGSVGKKLLERTGLRNPVTHYTTGSGATEILKSGTIRGRDQAFPGKPFKQDTRKEIAKRPLLTKFPIAPGSPAVSVTRDPMFLSRPHVHVGSDIGLIMDRDQLVKKGMKIQPFAEAKYGKVLPYLHTQYKKMNPRFEFEERVRGYIPTENIRLIDLAYFPQGAGKRFEAADMLNQLSKSNIPIIRSPETTDQIRLMDEMFRRYRPQSRRYSGSTLQENLNRLLEAPTY